VDTPASSAIPLYDMYEEVRDDISYELQVYVSKSVNKSMSSQEEEKIQNSNTYSNNQAHL